uniref:Phlebovirus_G2 domain-containing protein n=1 Tax=Heterorhabditis bacteriophora TaxID=37862 RepID=A0A1I7WFG1_HETBA
MNIYIYIYIYTVGSEVSTTSVYGLCGKDRVEIYFKYDKFLECYVRPTIQISQYALSQTTKYGHQASAVRSKVGCEQQTIACCATDQMNRSETRNWRCTQESDMEMGTISRPIISIG